MGSAGIVAANGANARLTPLPAHRTVHQEYVARRPMQARSGRRRSYNAPRHCTKESMVKILLLVDGSEYTAKAAEYLIKHLSWFKDTRAVDLQLLHVTPQLPRGLGVATIERNMGSSAVGQYYTDEGADALAPADVILKKNGIGYRYTHEIGDIAEKIHDFIAKNGIELVVMGSHGRTGLKSLVMGSVATRVVAASTVPILIVR